MRPFSEDISLLEYFIEKVNICLTPAWLTSLLVQETPVEGMGGIAPTESHEEIVVGF